MSEIEMKPPVVEAYNGCEIVAQPWYYPDEKMWQPRVTVNDSRGPGGLRPTIVGNEDNMASTYEEALETSLEEGRRFVDR